MRLLQDGLVAMLAAVGLATILWMVASLFLRNRRRLFSNVAAVVQARGAGENLEYTVHTLSQLRYDRGAFGTIVILDCGLTEEGRELAQLLTREEDCVALCPGNRRPIIFSEVHRICSTKPLTGRFSA